MFSILDVPISIFLRWSDCSIRSCRVAFWTLQNLSHRSSKNVLHSFKLKLYRGALWIKIKSDLLPIIFSAVHLVAKAQILFQIHKIYFSRFVKLRTHANHASARLSDNEIPCCFQIVSEERKKVYSMKPIKHFNYCNFNGMHEYFLRTL